MDSIGDGKRRNFTAYVHGLAEIDLRVDDQMALIDELDQPFDVLLVNDNIADIDRKPPNEGRTPPRYPANSKALQWRG